MDCKQRSNLGLCLNIHMCQQSKKSEGKQEDTACFHDVYGAFDYHGHKAQHQRQPGRRGAPLRPASAQTPARHELLLNRCFASSLMPLADLSSMYFSRGSGSADILVPEKLEDAYLVGGVSSVPRIVKVDDNPWCSSPVHTKQVLGQEVPLRASCIAAIVSIFHDHS